MINGRPLSRPALVVSVAVLAGLLTWLALPRLTTAQISPPATTLQPPAAPTNLRIDSNSLVWDDNSDNEDGFRIYRSVGGALPEVVATLPADTTSVRLDTLPPVVRVDECDLLTRWVVAFNEAGESATTLRMGIFTTDCGGFEVSPPPLGRGPADSPPHSVLLVLASLALATLGGVALLWGRATRR